MSGSRAHLRYLEILNKISKILTLPSLAVPICHMGMANSSCPVWLLWELNATVMCVLSAETDAEKVLTKPHPLLLLLISPSLLFYLCDHTHPSGSAQVPASRLFSLFTLISLMISYSPMALNTIYSLMLFKLMTSPLTSPLNPVFI